MSEEKDALLEELARLRRLLITRNRSALIGSMIGNFIHDLNNPLTAVNGNVELLQLSPVSEDAKVKKRLDTIQTGTRRISEKLRSVQLFSKAGRADAMIDVCEVVRETARVAEYLPKPVKVPVTVELPADPLVSTGNSNQLAQALLAIVDNALDAVAQVTGPTISITANRAAAGGIVISVKNNGLAIDAAIGNQIFEPFFTTKPDNVGVGLTVARQLIADNRGNLDWHSTPEQTEFIIQLG